MAINICWNCNSVARWLSFHFYRILGLQINLLRVSDERITQNNQFNLLSYEIAPEKIKPN